MDKPAILALANAQRDYLTTARRRIHENPELSFHERETSAYVAAELRAAGLEPAEGFGGGFGVVADLDGGRPGPTIALRADMDALPVQEENDLPFRSRNAGVMHACGHDVHITSMVGTAKRLAAMKDRWKGTVLFVVQPAEERLGGAKAMLEDGLYTRFPKPDYALAFHVGAALATGKVSASEGIQYSSADAIDIIVHGIGAHGAAPNSGRDPIHIGAQIAVAMQGIIGREIEPLKPAVITVGAFHGGSKHNIISDRAHLQLTVRANDEETRAQLLAAIRRVSEGIARANGMPEGTPTTINDAALARRLNAVLSEGLGAGSFLPYVQTGMGAEDFAYFIEPKYGVKGYYFAVGGTPQAAFDAEKAGGPPVPSHHSPLFKIDPEPSVRVGAEAMTLAVLDLLRPGASAAGN
jgi:amidohydrolase